jgi:hypothetical protein
MVRSSLPSAPITMTAKVPSIGTALGGGRYFIYGPPLGSTRPVPWAAQRQVSAARFPGPRKDHDVFQLLGISFRRRPQSLRLGGRWLSPRNTRFDDSACTGVRVRPRAGLRRKCAAAVCAIVDFDSREGDGSAAGSNIVLNAMEGTRRGVNV